MLKILIYYHSKSMQPNRKKHAFAEVKYTKLWIKVKQIKV